MQSIGFLRSNEDHYLYNKDAPDGSPIFLILYVDDILHSGRHSGELAELRWQIRLKFAMKDLGPAHHILGMRITRDQTSKGLWLT